MTRVVQLSADHVCKRFCNFVTFAINMSLYSNSKFWTNKYIFCKIIYPPSTSFSIDPYPFIRDVSNFVFDDLTDGRAGYKAFLGVCLCDTLLPQTHAGGRLSTSAAAAMCLQCTFWNDQRERQWSDLEAFVTVILSSRDIVGRRRRPPK